VYANARLASRCTCPEQAAPARRRDGTTSARSVSSRQTRAQRARVVRIAVPSGYRKVGAVAGVARTVTAGGVLHTAPPVARRISALPIDCWCDTSRAQGTRRCGWRGARDMRGSLLQDQRHRAERAAAARLTNVRASHRISSCPVSLSIRRDDCRRVALPARSTTVPVLLPCRGRSRDARPSYDDRAHACVGPSAGDCASGRQRMTGWRSSKARPTWPRRRGDVDAITSMRLRRRACVDATASTCADAIAPTCADVSASMRRSRCDSRCD
jgi:hypothetical protein